MITVIEDWEIRNIKSDIESYIDKRESFAESCKKWKISSKMARELWQHQVCDIYRVWDNIEDWAISYICSAWTESPRLDDFENTTEHDWYSWLFKYKYWYYLGSDNCIYEHDWQGWWSPC